MKQTKGKTRRRTITATESPQQVARRREQQLKRQLPGVDRLLSFFRAAGVRVEVVKQGALRIDGGQTRPLAWMLPRTVDWDSVIDQMVMQYVGGRFVKAVADNARFGEGLRAFLRQREKGFAIMRDDVRLATIYPTRAHIPHREVVHANFLMAGAHWQQVADLIGAAEADLVAAWKREQEAKEAAEAAAAAKTEGWRPPVQRRFDELPSDLAPEIIAACLDASRRIRIERQVAYERPVILETDVGELTLMPIKGEVRLVVPFGLRRGSETLTGELLLSDHDPLPLVTGEDVSDQDAVTAWVSALLGFADATCIDLDQAEPRARHEPATPQRRHSSSTPQPRSAARALPRRQPWPTHLQPIGQWARYSSSFVAGHRRRLADGQAASDDARERAHRVGITLRPHETWVQAHTRGVPDNIEMRFRWHAPVGIRLARARPD